ncbi:TIGR01244 family sulfur transferase [Actibacterium sp. 188UL27-1]|uniref:TIGR01244 family sulfur transferase n=1 Tax=Actibacterium sp. 188UL27-1 TaxID=2786961 RepID=UPI001959C516|nr:TIGR01244 family sulfur transferase [Actibacterium sp. 188UL27-1]MBM7068336.1 TIGR01244 family phosphatase [Actibacterium sp. 188UL27-1]
MDIRPLTPAYAVSPQIAVTDLPAISAAGYKTVLCNRPDHEIPLDCQATAIRAATEQHGLIFVENPVIHSAMTEEIIALQRQTVEENGPVLAYCASGTRSTVVWMLGYATDTSAEDLLAAATRGGYQLDHLRPHLDARYQG